MLPHYASQKALAAALGIDRVSLSRVLNGHATITPRIAKALENLGHGTARQWVRAQAAWDLERSRQK